MDHQLAIPKHYQATTAAWYPAAVNLVGTVDITQGRTLYGSTSPTPTAFIGAIDDGDWIINTATNEIHKVLKVIDLATIQIDKPFTVSTSTTATLARIRPGQIKEIQYYFSVANGSIVGATQLSEATQSSFTAATKPFGIPFKIKADGGIDPQYITPGSSGTAFVTLI